MTLISTRPGSTLAATPDTACRPRGVARGPGEHARPLTLVLVSGSPRRRELLLRLGFRVEVVKQIHENDCYSRLGPQGGIRAVIPLHDTATYSTMVTLVNYNSSVTTTNKAVDFYDKQGQLQKQLNVESLEKIGKYWISKKSLMEDVQKNHKTVMEMVEIKFDQPIPDENFTERFLQKP